MTILRLVIVLLFAAFAIGEELISALRGICDDYGDCLEVYAPADPGYSAISAPFNQRIKVRPKAVVVPSSVSDIVKIMEISANHTARVVARSGGHSYVANGLGATDGAVSIDMRNIKSISVNSANKTVHIGAGNRLGTVVQALYDKGLALPHGTCPYVGFGGHTGYGGYGFTSRQWGLALDPITGLEAVLANGTVVTANTSHNSELFWGLRGASSSFGIVTHINATAFDAPDSVTVFNYTWDLNIDQAVDGFMNFQTVGSLESLDQRFGGEIRLERGSAVGKVMFRIFGGWYGSKESFADVIKPFLKNLPLPNKEEIIRGTYLDSVIYFGDLGGLDVSGPDRPDTFYAKSLMTPDDAHLSKDAVSKFITYLANEGFKANTNWFVGVELWGNNSKINKVASNATAFANRNSLFAIQFYTSAQHNTPPIFPDEGFKFLDDTVNSLLAVDKDGYVQWPKGYGTFSNYPDPKLEGWQQKYFGDNYHRLQKLKREVDPKYIFNFTHSIELPGTHESERDRYQKVVDFVHAVEQVLLDNVGL